MESLKRRFYESPIKITLIRLISIKCIILTVNGHSNIIKISLSFIQLHISFFDKNTKRIVCGPINFE